MNLFISSLSYMTKRDIKVARAVNNLNLTAIESMDMTGKYSRKLFPCLKQKIFGVRCYKHQLLSTLMERQLDLQIEWARNTAGFDRGYYERIILQLNQQLTVANAAVNEARSSTFQMSEGFRRARRKVRKYLARRPFFVTDEEVCREVIKILGHVHEQSTGGEEGNTDESNWFVSSLEQAEEQ